MFTKLICEGRCGRGARRESNQDNIFVNGQWRRDCYETELFSASDTAANGVYAVCDGMGGESFGEEASLLAVAALDGISAAQFFARGEAILQDVNEQICELMRQRNTHIGTTFAAIAVKARRCRIINIGDSRIYLLRDGIMSQCSRDHTQVQRLVDMGMISPAEAATHRDRHKLTQHLGILPEEMVIEPYVSDVLTLRRKDLFLLCSDGLTDMLTHEQIASVLLEELTLAEKADRLYDLAVQYGGKDNISVVLLSVC